MDYQRQHTTVFAVKEWRGWPLLKEAQRAFDPVDLRRQCGNSLLFQIVDFLSKISVGGVSFFLMPDSLNFELTAAQFTRD